MAGKQLGAGGYRLTSLDVQLKIMVLCLHVSGEQQLDVMLAVEQGDSMVGNAGDNAVARSDNRVVVRENGDAFAEGAVAQAVVNSFNRNAFAGGRSHKIKRSSSHYESSPLEEM